MNNILYALKATDAVDRAMWTLFAICVLGLTFANSLNPIDEHYVKTLSSPEIMQQELTYRLPTNVNPSKYLLNILVDVDNESFNGNVIINLEVISSTPSIHLNYKDIYVDWSNARLQLDNSTEIFSVIDQVNRPIEQIYELHFDRRLEVGTYTLELEFVGAIRHDLTGLYKSSYTFTNGNFSETRYVRWRCKLSIEFCRINRGVIENYHHNTKSILMVNISQ